MWLIWQTDSNFEIHWLYIYALHIMYSTYLTHSLCSPIYLFMFVLIWSIYLISVLWSPYTHFKLNNVEAGRRWWWWWCDSNNNKNENTIGKMHICLILTHKRMGRVHRESVSIHCSRTHRHSSHCTRTDGSQAILGALPTIRMFGHQVLAPHDDLSLN